MVEQWNLGTRGCPETFSFKGKFIAQTEKPRGKTKGHEGKCKSGAGGRTAVRPRKHSRVSITTGRAQNHGQPVVPPAQSCLRSASLLRRLLFLAHGTCYAMLMLSHFWASLAFFFDQLGLKNIF